MQLVKQGRAAAAPSIAVASRQLMAHASSHSLRFRASAVSHGPPPLVAQTNTDEDAGVREAVLLALQSTSCHCDVAVAEVI